MTSRSGRVRDVFFFEGDYDLHVQIGDLVALEEIRLPHLARYGFGPEEASCEKIAARLATGGALVEEVRQVLRLALIGGGLTPVEAHDLVARNLTSGNLLECKRIAYAALSAALVGMPEDPIAEDLEAAPGEAKGKRAKPAKRASPTGASAGPTSTASARRSASRPATSIG